MRALLLCCSRAGSKCPPTCFAALKSYSCSAYPMGGGDILNVTAVGTPVGSQVGGCSLHMEYQELCCHIVHGCHGLHAVARA